MQLKSDHKIRILFILPKAQQGGAETQLLYLLNGIDKNKFKLYLGFLYHSSEMEHAFSKVKNVIVKQFDKKGKLDIGLYLRIAAFIKKNEIDIVHSFLGSHHAYLPSFIANTGTSVGGIMGAHGLGWSISEKITELALGKIFAKHYNFVLVSCSHIGIEGFLQQGFPKKSLFVIPNGIDFSRFSNGNRKKILTEFHLDDTTIVLSTVGRIIPTKNHEALIMMFKDIVQLHKKTVLFIIGNGPLLSRLKKTATNLGLESRVIFTGNRNDIPNMLAATDVFLFPSLTEGWPNVVGEAMSAGVPVVSYDVGDVKYIIENGHNGFIVGKDINEMKNKTIYLIKNKTDRKKIGKNGRAFMKKYFSVDKMVDSYEKLYFDLHAKNQSRVLGGASRKKYRNCLIAKG